MLTKKEKKRISRSLDYKNEFPERCCCGNPIFGELINTELFDNILTAGQHEVHFYKCKNCGKELDDQIPVA